MVRRDRIVKLSADLTAMTNLSKSSSKIIRAAERSAALLFCGKRQWKGSTKRGGRRFPQRNRVG